MINAVGKINKWLFGTLDADDETKYDKYINTLIKNQESLYYDTKNSMTILSNITQTYKKDILIIENNQQKIQERIESLDAKSISLAENLYLSLILDNINNQLQKIKTILINIETAVTFAKLGVMHNTILNEFQLNEVVNIFEKESFLQFTKLISYYKIMTPQVKIISGNVIFAIHIPIIEPVPYELYKIIPIPILNRTIISKPYLLLTDHDYYSALEECPKVEDTFICTKEMLSQEDSCTAEILRTNQNTCPVVNVQFNHTNIQRLNDKEVLIIPAKPTLIKNNCQESKRSISVDKPTLIIMNDCPLTINGQLFTKQKSSNLFYSLEIPRMAIPEETGDTPQIHLQTLNHRELLEASKIISTIKLHELQNPGISINHWIPAVSTFAAMSMVFAIFLVLWIKRNATKRNVKKTSDIELQEPEKRQPLFSES